ncbi:MAG: DUF3306 domain-containing protein [Alphaproteobacteria bacterium]|jgi:hypothetical protein|nr:DUF3306 domain-containing protein [Alphaproteobacteria bacterium]MBT5160575.1 DUF3306 domain-containing protein [Alphaproteobacteria bacterium]MBT6386796.1 DUF3306 domain-containing protein [Alphaproteobacteria bacterium]
MSTNGKAPDTDTGAGAGTDALPGESRFQRWSRLKSDDRSGPAEPDQSLVVDDPEGLLAGADEADEVADTRTTEEIVADLPDIETLEKDSDFTGFMQAGVPEELKNLALKKLWLSDPVLANVDGLNDYDDDFNVIDKVIEIASDVLDKVSDSAEKLEEVSETEAATTAENAGEEVAPASAEPSEAIVAEVDEELPAQPDIRPPDGLEPDK